MSDQKDSRNGVKTLGIKLQAGLHAQFALIAQLDDMSLADAAVRAVELYVSTKTAESDFATRASAALEEIEREAAERRGAIQSLFGDNGTSPAAATKASGPRGRKAGDEGSPT